MSRLAFGFFLGSLAISTHALAAGDPPFVGTWAVEGSKACKPSAGDYDLKLTVTAKQLNYYASSCAVLSSRRLSRSSDDAHRLKLRCIGEEKKTTNSELILVVLEKNEQRPDLLLHIDPAGWEVRSYLRCGS